MQGLKVLISDGLQSYSTDAHLPAASSSIPALHYAFTAIQLGSQSTLQTMNSHRSTRENSGKSISKPHVNWHMTLGALHGPLDHSSPKPWKSAPARTGLR
eukprot:Skav200515  [mRNA]  locus=scaffold450:494535:496080:+ [translate_table: standard]